MLHGEAFVLTGRMASPGVPVPPVSQLVGLAYDAAVELSNSNATNG